MLPQIEIELEITLSVDPGTVKLSVNEFPPGPEIRKLVNVALPLASVVAAGFVRLPPVPD